MEFFEKAHAPLNDDSKKDKKPEEKIKKKLKQMLYGYKKSDNELIRKSENVEESDSTSVSGFSDLNLSNANSDNETTRATLDSSDLDSISNLIDSNEASLIEGTYSPTRDVSEDVLSNPKSERESLSELHEENDTVFTFGSSNISTTETKSDTESSTPFDPDGVLAGKIRNRLYTVKVPHEKLKRKIIDIEEHSRISTCEQKELIEPKISKKENYDAFTCENMQFFDYADVKSNDNKGRVTYTVKPTSTFVSITSKNAKTENFDDIMGHYRNATVKNISHERHNATFSPFNISDDDNHDIQVDSSISDLGVEVNVSDSNLSESIAGSEVQNDSVNDNTIQSPMMTEDLTSDDGVCSTEKYKIFYGEDCVIVVLKHPSELFIHGKVIVKKLGGCAQIYGFNLGNKPYFVYAPFYNFAHCVRTLQGTNIHTGLFDSLTAKGVSISEAEEIVTEIGTYDVVLALEKLYSTELEFSENHFKACNLFNRTADNVPLNLKRASEMLGCSLYPEQPYKHFQENPNWQEAARFGISSGDTSIGMVCGGKGSGKSTFLRYYVNRQLSCSAGPILVVDLDPGQCEFTIAGSISATVVLDLDPLLGPNFTHLKKPNVMLNIGMINTMDNPKRYLNAVDQLIAECKDNDIMSNIPWVVNTMGMCNTIGLKFISYIILRIQPTFLLQIELQNMKKNFPYRLTSQKVEELYEQYKHDKFFANLSRQDPLSYAYVVTGAETFRTNTNSDNMTLAARDQRYLNLLSYFGGIADYTSSLLNITPHSVSLQDLYVATNIRIHRDSITKVLNGKVVALCKHTDKTAKVFTLTDKPLLCYGHGLIRGIENETLYVITPVSADNLSLVNAVLYTDWMPELRGQEKYLTEGTMVPYRMLSQYQQRQLISAPRRRFNPIQLLKMSKNS
ncbi:Polynucleotide 5'-hydroxyl-kinase NOL9 [Papilio machaon]|uniref:Polynucleotide 5'-hydroxyl-kinase NOL9 n=1 Tax=Papilio machaon TaxID=76193 RepID=A0A194R169_PAPMA|nr:Polynucleotide 5'-hydroxyl-kinase NOL9 [Papilio machaon]